MTNFVMVDIETLGLSVDAPVLSLGAVFWNVESGETLNTFYEKISLGSNLRNNKKIEESTLLFWLDQPREVFKDLLKGTEDLYATLHAFKEWYSYLNTDVRHYVWANGPSFDIAILEANYRYFGIEVPWPYNYVRDCRTLYHLAGLDPKSIAQEGTQHNALSDAKFQAKCVTQAYLDLASKK